MVVFSLFLWWFRLYFKIYSFMCVCVHVLGVCVYICMCTVLACVHDAHMRVCMCVVCMYLVCVYVFVCAQCLCMCMVYMCMMCVCAHACVYTYMQWCTCEAQRTILWGQFSPSTFEWVLGIKLRFAQEAPLSTVPPPWPSGLTFKIVCSVCFY